MDFQTSDPHLSFSKLRRIGGAGYRTNNLTSEEVSTLVYEIGFSSLDLWLGRGKPLNPFLKAEIVRLLREEFKPKQLTLLPLRFSVGFLRMVYVKGMDAMRSWLGYLKWYHTVGGFRP